ncbi:mediator of RNA polymerase II transcription subunit 1-domain-containing protein [Ilyonectria robusta]|uniref:mediator of RNA polymerase II transcription subunit 1-domain-containing protein n=1 Tax=Ilyonectria robusta TaxID=1079257 RepID=UPI001E8E0F86|nr:mediator of RNA polymerase II transcription subunit 1-domain-containing protein [Ilyonectria robusta]KAH8699625.1 mediator of RNA polymerase II transcription subunit 1-domain-containing protein [Ilyonectria robusta]
MATPTAMKHVASQQGRTPSQFAAATPPVSTPFSNPAHAVFSPRGPRSSPQQFKKSPATSGMMAQQSNAPLNFDSPSTAAAMGALAMGGGLDMGLESVSVAGLGHLGALVSEDDKLKRLEAIMEMLNKKKGLVSEVGLERLAQRIGLDCLSEEQTASNGRKTRILVIAGSAIQLDIVLDNNIVTNISLAFPESATSVTKHVDRASQILLQDLQLLPDQSPLTKTLDKFAVNLERLANLDKLSIIPGLDCHEALAGIYVSLEKLHQWDISKLREEPGMSDKTNRALSIVAMCTRHGYPIMHSRERVGLAVQYWKALRLIPPSNDQSTTFSETREKVWSLLVGCASTGGMAHLPVRVSENWISNEIVKAEPSMDPKKPNLDWQDPANVVLPASEENKNAGIEMLQPDLSTATVPQVMFTVTFDPPVILPQNDWMRLHAFANVNAPPVFGYPPTFDSLFFPIPPGSTQDPSELRTITRQRDVRVYDKDRTSSIKPHRNTLFIYKQIYSQVVTEMPFSHPQQLIEMMPLLRQYAFISTLLENSFGSKTKETQPVATNGQAPGPGANSSTTTTKDELADFMNMVPAPVAEEPKKQAPSEEYLNLDVTLWVHPTPHLQVVFPFRNSTANITLKVLEEGIVEVANENVIPREGDTETRKLKSKELTRADLGRVLEHMEDLCKWAEWIRTRLS